MLKGFLDPGSIFKSNFLLRKNKVLDTSHYNNPITFKDRDVNIKKKH